MDIGDEEEEIVVVEPIMEPAREPVKEPAEPIKIPDEVPVEDPALVPAGNLLTRAHTPDVSKFFRPHSDTETTPGAGVRARGRARRAPVG